MMEKLEEAIKNLREAYDRTSHVNIELKKVEHEFVALEKACVIVPRKKLEDFNVFEWLKENHRDKERFAVLGANLIETLQSFIKKELLGVEKTS